jgi:hypothetical protein
MTMPPKGSDPGRPIRRWILTALIVSALGICVLVAICLAWRWRLTQELNERVAAIQAEGLPINWEDLKTWPDKIALEENVASVYTNALRLLAEEPAPDSSEIVLPRRAEPIPADTLAFISLMVATNSAALSAVRNISNPSRSRYPIQLQDGPFAKLPHLAKLKRLGLLLGWEALVKAQSGDAPGAVEAVNASLNLSHSLDQEPFLISQLLSGSILIMSCRPLEWILCRTALSEEQLAQLGAALASSEATNRHLTGLMGQRALDNEFIRLAHEDPRKMAQLLHGSSNDANSESPRGSGTGWRVIGFFERDRNFYLRAMHTNILIASVGPPASLSMTNAITDLMRQAAAGYYPYSSLLLPGPVNEKDALVRSHLRVALTAIAIERWRKANSDLIPQTLADLVPLWLPATPVDPFDGAPLRFKRLPKGYLIYSIGPDLQDDEGAEMPSQSTGSRDGNARSDITFTVER